MTFKVGDKVRTKATAEGLGVQFRNRFGIIIAESSSTYDFVLDIGAHVNADEIDLVESDTVILDYDDYDVIIQALLLNAQFTESEEDAIEHLRVLRKITGLHVET